MFSSIVPHGGTSFDSRFTVKDRRVLVPVNSVRLIPPTLLSRERERERERVWGGGGGGGVTHQKTGFFKKKKPSIVLLYIAKSSEFLNRFRSSSHTGCTAGNLNCY